MSQTLEQKRAKYALYAVNGKKNCGYKKNYTTFVRRMPTMILNNGLGQALAFLLSKQSKEGNEKEAAEKFYEELQKWLCGAKDEEHPVRVYNDNTTNKDLITFITEGYRDKYNQAQAEALSLLNWMGKFVDAYLSEEK